MRMMTKQVVKIFTADQIKDWALETVINEFLKENPDHKIILTDYSWNGKDAGSMFEERALIVFEVSDSTSTGSGGRKKSKPKPKSSPRKPRKEPSNWSGKSWQQDVYQGSKSPNGQAEQGTTYRNDLPPQRVRQ